MGLGGAVLMHNGTKRDRTGSGRNLVNKIFAGFFAGGWGWVGMRCGRLRGDIRGGGGIAKKPCYNGRVRTIPTHPDFEATLPAWLRARDVLAGEDAVKGAGEKYLPRMDCQSDEEYAAYKARASFFGATARTLEEYLDLVFRRAPMVGVGESKGLTGFVADCDLWGTELTRYARRVVGEVLAVGRAGSLVLWDPPSHGSYGATSSTANRPWVSLWRAEEIINWRVERNGQAVALVEIVLRDSAGSEKGDSRSGQVRVLKLVDGQCVQEIWRAAQDNGEAAGDAGWLLVERVTVKREGVALSFIPFVFHGPRHSRPEVDRLPLADIIAANLDHYRLDADFKYGLHFTAMPTAWVSGFENSTLLIGSRTAWVSTAPGATAGFLEFTGAGLVHMERALERAERRMALLGARLLEVPSPEGDGVGVTMASGGAQLCGLGSVVASLNQSLSRVLELARWWIEGGEHVGASPGVTFAMNTDLAARAITGEGLTAVVAAWRAGAISRESMLEVLKRGEVLPDGRTVAQERALIHRLSGAAVG